MESVLIRKIEHVEPLQLAVDLLQKMLALEEEGELPENYWEGLIRAEGRELLEDYLSLVPSYSLFHRGLLYSEGMNAGRLLVMRTLLSILPPFSLSHLPVNTDTAKEIFRDTLVYLETLQMSSEKDCPLWQKAVFSAVQLLLQRGFSPYLLRRGGVPLLVAAPPYREQTEACYLKGPHTIVLYSIPEQCPARRIYLVLHETGHLLYQKYLSGRKQQQGYLYLLSRLQPLGLDPLLEGGRQGQEEVFCNLFAMSILLDTQEGELLFGGYYRKIGKLDRLLRRIFSPGVLLKTSH